MATPTDPRTGEPIPAEIAREPITPPPGNLGDRIVPPPAYRGGLSTTSIMIGVLALVAIVFVFMGMDRGSAPPPPLQQTSEPAPPPPAPATPPAPTVQ
jgi:hypothetical protein